MRIHGVPDPSCPDCRYDGHYATCTAWAERHGRPETRADMTPDNPADRRLTLAEFVVARIFAREAGYRPGDPHGIPYTFETQGESPEYLAWVASFKDGEDGPETYAWDEGIAP